MCFKCFLLLSISNLLLMSQNPFRCDQTWEVLSVPQAETALPSSRHSLHFTLENIAFCLFVGLSPLSESPRVGAMPHSSAAKA